MLQVCFCGGPSGIIFFGKTSGGIAKCRLFSQVRVGPTDFRTETHKFLITVYNMSPRTHFIVWQIVTQSLIPGLGWSVAGLGKRSGELRLHTLFLGQTEAPRGKKTNYYSFKIFGLFWLAKIPDIIQHKQLLSTKFGRILWYWTDDINRAAKWTGYWTVNQEDLATSLICFGSEYKLAKHFTRFTVNYCVKQEQQVDNSIDDICYLEYSADLNGPLSPKLPNKHALSSWTWHWWR